MWSMDNGVHSVCFRDDFAIKTMVGFLRLNSFYPRPTKLEGGYTGFTLSVRPSVRPSVRLSVDDMVSGA